MGNNDFIFAVEKWFRGPDFYLSLAQQEMKEYHQKHGFYPINIEELEAESDNPGQLQLRKDKNYTYRVVKATIDYFHVVSENNKGLRNYEVTSEMRYPMWIFKDQKDREKAKDELLLKMEKGSQKERRRLIFDFENFPDEDTKNYLMNIIKNMGEDERLRSNASTILKKLILNKDVFLIPELLKLLQSEQLCLSIKHKIVQIFGILKDQSTLPALKRIAVTEKDIHYYPIKTEAERVIKEIEQ